MGKAESGRLNLRLAECLTSRTALLLTYLSYATGSNNYSCIGKPSLASEGTLPTNDGLLGCELEAVHDVAVLP